MFIHLIFKLHYKDQTSTTFTSRSHSLAPEEQYANRKHTLDSLFAPEEQYAFFAQRRKDAKKL
jgi:hypothetical protein